MKQVLMKKRAKDDNLQPSANKVIWMSEKSVIEYPKLINECLPIALNTKL